MKHPITALLLACITVGFVFSFLSLAPLYKTLDRNKTKVRIEAESNVTDIVAAIDSLKRNDVVITTTPHVAFRPRSIISEAFLMALVMLLNFGVILFFYKLYSHLLGIKPII